MINKKDLVETLQNRDKNFSNEEMEILKDLVIKNLIQKLLERIDKAETNLTLIKNELTKLKQKIN